MAPWAGLIALAYLVGSIPFGFMLARAKGVDIREHGSGNIGATNVGRILGKGLGRLCLALDIAKGLGPTLGAGIGMGLVLNRAAPESDVALWLAVAVAAVLGHMFPPWLKFKGGKGVATGLGAMLGVFPVLTAAALASVVMWIATLKATRYVGVSSCVAAASMPAWVGLERALGAPWGITWAHAIATVLLAALVVWRHRANLGRTLRGTEPKRD